MSSWGYRAPPTSWATVAEKAWQVRLTAGLDAEPYFPVMPFLERVLNNAAPAAITLERPRIDTPQSSSSSAIGGTFFQAGVGCSSSVFGMCREGDTSSMCGM